MVAALAFERCRVAELGREPVRPGAGGDHEGVGLNRLAAEVRGAHGSVRRLEACHVGLADGAALPREVLGQALDDTVGVGDPAPGRFVDGEGARRPDFGLTLEEGGAVEGLEGEAPVGAQLPLEGIGLEGGAVGIEV